MKSIVITAVVGARPNFIKMAALMHEMKQRPHLDVQLVHTGQHFSPEMSQSFFDELELPEPDHNLAIAGGTQTEQTAEIMKALEPLFTSRKPDVLLVVGDVTSTLAASLVASKLGIRIAHVEAGLRSFDRAMPEEINRIITDAVSDFLFVTEPGGEENLRNEGVPPSRIFFTGNVMIDTLLRFREKASRSTVLERCGLSPRNYVVVTLHRPSNVDDPERLESLLGVLGRIGERISIVFPVHPRTQQRIAAMSGDNGNLRTIPPQSYLDFLNLMSNARMVLTDSGGIQEETTILQVPCLTLRENTERPITITRGTNRLVGVQASDILQAATEVLDSPMPSGCMPDLWDGKAAGRILDTIERLV